MKSRFAVALSVGAVSFVLVFAQPMRAQSGEKTQPARANATPMAGTHEAALMVPAQAYLVRDLDAKKDHSGESFEAKLSDSVQLKNGPELPKGTILTGVIENDDMQIHAQSKLALRITNAELKDGKVIPVKATIVGIDAPQSTNYEGFPVAPGGQAPNDWNKETLAVDQIGALHDVDLHSRISGKNSGVLDSTRNNNMKLREGTELELAIAEGHA
jgi:hypothetical protein